MADTTIKFLSYTGLSQYDGLIKGYVDAAVNAVGVETAKAFKAVALKGNDLVLYTENPYNEEATPKYSVTLPFAEYQLLVKTAEKGNIATFDENGQVVDSGIAMEDVATKSEVKVVSDDLAAYKTANDAAVKAVADDLAALDEKVGDLPEGTEATTVIEYINKKTEGIATDAALGELQDAVDAIEADYLKAADKTELSDAIADEVERATGVEEGLAARIKAVEDDYLVEADKTELANAIKAISDDYLVADDKTALEGKITAEENRAKDEEARIEGLVTAEAAKAREEEGKLDARLVEVETFFKTAEGETLDTALDTLVEIQKYLDGEGEVADQMLLDIAANKKAIEDHAKIDHDFATADATLKSELEGKIALKADQTALEAEVQRATAAEAKALEDANKYTDAEVLKDRNRLDALEAKFTGDDSVADQIEAAVKEAKDYTDAEVKELADGAVAGNTAAIEAINNETTGILAQAKEHANGLNDAMNARVEALEAIGHDHANKEVLDGITAEKVAAWDAAEQNAKDHADDLNEAMDTRVKAVEDSIAEGGATANAIKDAHDAADKAQGEVDALEEVVATKAAQADLEAEATARDNADKAIEAKIGEVAEGKTVVGMMNEADTALSNRITALESVTHEEITLEEIQSLFNKTEA